MTFRVTVTLGRPTLDRKELLAEGLQLDQALRTADVSVDPVKAAVDVLLTVDAPDALMAATLTLGQIITAFESAQLQRPATVISLEAEAVPRTAEEDPFPEVVE